MTRTLCGLTIALFAGFAAGAPRSLVDRALLRTPVDLVAWGESEVAYLDELGELREEPVENYVAILPPGPRGARGWKRPPADALAGGTPVVVELIDGQRLIGSIGPWDSAALTPEMSGDAVGVLTPGFGGESVGLDRVARVLIDPWSRGVARHEGWTPGADDELVLANGDRVKGFLVAIGEMIEFDTGTGIVLFPLDRVAEARLGNPPEAWSGPRVWWTSGAVRDAGTVGDAEEGVVRVADGASTAMFEIGEIESAWLAEGRLIPLGELELVSFEPLGRRWTGGPKPGSSWSSALGAPHVALDGPMRAEWSVPPAASRFGTVARLGGTLDDPSRSPGRWSEVELRITIAGRDGEREVARVPLDRDSAAGAVGVPLPWVGEPGRTLVIEVLPGRYGPIQDRVLLDHPVLVGF